MLPFLGHHVNHSNIGSFRAWRYREVGYLQILDDHFQISITFENVAKFG